MTIPSSGSRRGRRVRPLLAALAALSLATVARAQGDYRPGFFLPNGGDTVRASIAAAYGEITPQRFAYRHEGRERAVGPKDASVVELADGSRFERHFVPVDRSEERLRLTFEPAPDLSTELTFLEVLVRGDSLQLFRLSSGANDRYYVAPPGRDPELLSFRRYRAEDGGREVEYNGFRQQLGNAYFCEDQSVEEVARLDYTAAALARYVLAYNACVGGATASALLPAVSARDRPRFGVYAGAAFVDVSLRGDVALAFDPTVGLAIGLTAELPSLTFASGSQLVAAGHLGYVRFSTSAYERTDQPVVVSGVTYTRTFERAANIQAGAYVQSGAMARYVYGRGRWRPFLGGGMSIHLRTAETHFGSAPREIRLTDRSDRPSDPVPRVGTVTLRDSAPMSFGFAAGLGVEAFDDWTLEVRRHFHRSTDRGGSASFFRIGLIDCVLQWRFR